MKLHHPIPYSILIVATALAMTVWSLSMGRRMDADRDFLRMLRGDPRSVVETTEGGTPVPPRARSHSILADILAEELFPPPYDRSLEHVQQAILLHPLDSYCWVQAARFQMFRGNPGEARAALDISDQIDPRYPAQRIEAIRLWGLLGDQERATALAQNVARLGSPFREEAAGELAAIGVPPREIFALVADGDLSTDEFYNLTRSIIDADPRRVEETIRELPPAVVREPDFRRRLAVLLERTRRFELLLLVWEMEGAELEEVLPGLFVDNTDLSLPPRTGVFPLGWRGPADAPGVTMRWEAPTTGSSPSTGQIELTFTPDAGRSVRWMTYRTVAPAQTPITITVRLQVEPFYGGEVTLRGRSRVHLIHGPATDPRRSGWQTLSVTVPAHPQPEVLVAELEMVRRGVDTPGGRTVLSIDSISFSSPGGAAAP